MDKLSKHLKKLIVCLLVLSVGSMILYEKSSVYAFNSSSNNEKETVIRDVGINRESNNSINTIPSNVIIDKLQRKTVSRYANTVTGPDAFLNKKIKNTITKQVASTPIPTCVSGVPTTANVSNSNQFKTALESSAITCINITSGFKIELSILGQIYATITVSKTIVNNTDNANPINIDINFEVLFKPRIFYTTANVDITLYNITINYSSDLLNTNQTLFYGFNSINLNKSRVLQKKVIGYSPITNDNQASVIGSIDSITDTINITNGSEITGASSTGNIIVANNVNISNSTVLTHMSNKAGIYAFKSLNIYQNSVVDNVVYPDGAGIYSGEILSISDSEINVSYTSVAIELIPSLKYGIVVEKLGSIVNSALNVVEDKPNSSKSLLIDSRNNGNEAFEVNDTTVQINGVTRLFSGNGLSLRGSNILQDSTAKFNNTPTTSFNYISSDLLSLENSSITLNTTTENFFSGYSSTNGNMSVYDSSIILNYTGDFLTQTNTIYLSNINNLMLDNGEIIVNHHGYRSTSYFATLGFGMVTGKVRISGNHNIFAIKKATGNDNIIETKNYDEGFYVNHEHTFIKMLSDADFELNNAKLIYNGNVSLLSTEKTIVLKLNNSVLLANMSEEINETPIAAHSFISLRNRTTGSINIISERSKIDINHNSNYKSSNKPTISIIDDVYIGENDRSKITYRGNNSVLKISDNTVSGFTTPNGATSSNDVLGHKLEHNAIPLEISDMTFNNQSTFEYHNNYHFYPIVRAKSFVANNSNVFFNFSNFYQGIEDGTLGQSNNYYHLFYDQLPDTIFQFNLDRTSPNYIGASLKFSITSSRNNLTPYIITNGNKNIIAAIDYYNFANYGGSDYGREGLIDLEGNIKQRVTIRGGRDSGSSVFAEQIETFEQFGPDAGLQSSINLYPGGLPSCQANNQFNGRDCMISQSKPFFSALNRRKDAVFGDYIVDLDELLTYDENTEEYFVTGMASKDTAITIVNEAEFDSVPQENGLYKFRVKIDYDPLLPSYNVRSSYMAKTGTESSLSQNNSNALINFTRIIGYDIVHPKFDLSVNNNLVFGSQTISGSEQYLSRDPNNVFNIQIADSRYNSPGWILEMCMMDEMATTHNQSRKLMFNDLVYKNSNSKYITLESACSNRVQIAENLSSNPILTNLSWNHNEGVQLHIKNPWLILNGADYEGTIRFILTSK